MATTIIKTHPDFKSVDEKFRDATMINEYLREALNNQENFDRTFFPMHDDKLQKFIMNVSQINRLYHIHKTRTGSKEFEDGSNDVECVLIAKIDDNNNNNNNDGGDGDGDIYVEMGMEIYGGSGGDIVYGHIFFSRDPSVFMNLVLTNNNYFINKLLIYKSLTEDGIHLKNEAEIFSSDDFREIKNWYLAMRYNLYKKKSMN